MIAAKVSEHEAEAERAVLGAVLLLPSALGDVLEVVGPADFATKAHAIILGAMMELDAKGEPIDIITVQAILRPRGLLDQAGGATTIMALVESVEATASSARHYAEMVRGRSVLRRLNEAASRISTSTHDGTSPEEALDAAEASVLAIARPETHGGLVQVGAAVGAAYDQAVRMFDAGETTTGLVTGYPDLDRYTAGLQAGDLIVLAARPSMGKTSYAMNVSASVAKGGAVVAFFSLEMTRQQLGQRLICQEARIDLARFRSAQASAREWEAAMGAASRTSEMPLYVDDDRGVSVLDIRTRSRRLAATRGLGLVVVDYLGLIRARGGEQNREREVAEMSRGLKRLAGELNVPVLVLSQLNRDLEKRPANDRRPRLADLRDSGAVEQDADVVLFVYRDEVYNPESNDKDIAEIIIAKQRQGGLGVIRHRFDRTCTRFDSLDEYRPPPTPGRVSSGEPLPTRLGAHDLMAEARRNGEQR